MKEFDLSDKELKDLLKTEGLEEPSMGFNHTLLEKVEQYEKTKSRPVSIPTWLKVAYFSVIIIAISSLFIAGKGFDLQSTGVSEITNVLISSFNATVLGIALSGVVVVWMAFLLNRYFQHQSLPETVKKS